MYKNKKPFKNGHNLKIILEIKVKRIIVNKIVHVVHFVRHRKQSPCAVLLTVWPVSHKTSKYLKYPMC